MAEIKTKPTDIDPRAFIAEQPDQRRRDEGEVLMKLFEDATGQPGVMWGPSMVGFGQYHYVSPANSRNHGYWPKAGFSPRKAKISLYGIKDLAEGAAMLPKLGKYTEGMGCVYVNKLADIDLDVLREMVRIASTRTDD